METPVQIAFKGLQVSDTVRDAIDAHVAALEERCGRITACRVSITGPGEHHRSSGHYQVSIHIALPGGHEVNAERSPAADRRLSDLPFAINDAFHRARRQLQDRVREMQGQTKARSGPQ
jgi:ribosome-associated translation inhibitor RaiA